MALENKRWWTDPVFFVELFVILNLGILTLDIYLAHSMNDWRREAEYIPLFFSAIAPLVLAIGLALRAQWPAVWKDLGYLVAWAAIIIGFTGVILHLDSSFFYERTIKSLTYSAPFAAPLAYTGLGFVLLVDRMVDAGSIEWGRWIVFLTLGGFVGNFVFSLTDHAENGFFYHTEWAPIIASGIAIGFLLVPLLMRVSAGFLLLCGLVLLLQAGVGVWGFVLHAQRNLEGPSVHAFANFIYGAPPLAPLLFPNLVVLGMIGLWKLLEHTPF